MIEANQHPQEPRRQHPEKNSEEGITLEVFDEKAKKRRPGSQIEEMAEGKTAMYP
jgi:hypothetical protein